MIQKSIVRILILGSPLIMGTLSEYLMFIMDSVMVGRLSVINLASIGIATTFGEILWFIVWSLCPGTHAIAARRFGRLKTQIKNLEKDSCFQVGEVLYNAFFVALLASLVCWVIAFFAEYLLGFILNDPEVIRLSVSYIAIVKWAMPFGAIFYSMYGFLAAINRTKMIMVFTIIQTTLNIGLNYILIFGHLGFSPMGIQGAALGTTIGQIITSTLLVLLFLFLPELKIYDCLQLRRIKSELIMSVLKNSLPVATQTALAFAFYLIFESLVGRIGTSYLAATHVVLIILYINKSFIGGMAEGTAILVGNALGRKDEKEALNLIFACEILAVVISLLLLSIILLIPEMIIGLFNDDADLTMIGAKALFFFAPFFFIQSLGFTFQVIFDYNGWGKFVLASELATNLLFNLGLTFCLTQVFDLGIYGAWTSFALYLVVHSAVLCLGFFSKGWLKTTVEH